MLRTALSHRGLLSALDQGLAMLSNVLVAVVVVRVGGPGTLGAYTFAFSAYLIVLGFSRALISEPYLTHADEGLRQNEAGLAAAATATLAAAGLAGLATAGWAVASHRPELLVLTFLLPGLLMQDLLRYAFFRSARPGSAVVVDGLWVLSSAVVVSLGLVHRPWVAVAGWAAGAMFGAVWGVRRTRLRLAPIGEARLWWLRHARGVGSWLTLESVVFTLATQLSVLVVTTFATDALLGRIRAVQIVIGPLALILAALGMLLMPHFAVREHKMSIREALEASALASVLTAVGLLLLMAARHPISHLLFAGRLVLEEDLLVPLSVAQLAIAAAFGAGLYIRARRRARELFVSRLAGALISIPLVVLAATHASAPLLAWTLAAQAVVFLVVLFHQCHLLARRELHPPAQLGGAHRRRSRARPATSATRPGLHRRERGRRAKAVPPSLVEVDS